MMMNKLDIPIAQLNESQVSKIESLEQELRNETKGNVVLIAYGEK